MASGSFLAASALAESNDLHAQHRTIIESSSNGKSKVVVTQHQYTLPEVTLTNSLGQQVRVDELFSNHKPFALNFIFTTCTTICPVMTSTMLQFQRQLDDIDHTVPNIVSISIDPNYDQASTLKSYADMYGADWTFLTGDEEDVLEVLKALDAYRGNKVNHFPLTLLRPSSSPQWTRVEGMVSAKKLADTWIGIQG